MIYCTRCLYPNTKPDLFFRDGVCSACTAFDNRVGVDWWCRELEFIELVDKIKALKKTYDCVIPVSGGKDSTYQVIKALKYGLHPLAVTATTDSLSNLGRANLDNIAKLGCDHIEVTTNKSVRRRINKYTLREVGDISWAEHVTIFTIPVHMAIMYDIPLIIWGENPQNEYGGPYKSQTAQRLDNRWLQEYGGLNGLRTQDLIDQNIVLEKDLQLYRYPSLEKTKVSGVFLGQFFAWDGLENAIIAQQNGFKPYHKNVEGVGYNYENLDNHQTGIHDYFKYLKFGFGRCTDLVCNHIRRGRLSRADGIQIVLSYDGRYPNTYLGRSLEEILGEIDMKIDEFILICNRFANKDLFETYPDKPPRALFKGNIK